MVDPTGFRTFEPNATYNNKVYKQLDRDISDEQYAICNPIVLGFSLGAKLWGTITVSVGSRQVLTLSRRPRDGLLPAG